MSRRNPDKAKELISRYTKEVAKYGDDGKEELRKLFVGDRRPDVILALPPGPDRSARAAQLIGDLREIARELAEARAFISMTERRESQIADERKSSEAKASKIKGDNKKKEKPTDIVSKSDGKVDGFIYTIGKMRVGRYVVKITRKGRNVIEDERAPKIYDNDRLRKLFDSSDDAEWAARRVINTAMLWYDERGIQPREKARRSSRVRGGVLRRTASDREAISKEETETARIAARKRERARRAERDRDRKVRENPEKPLRHIPRANPSKPFRFFKHSESSAENQAKKSLIAYKKYEEKWKESLRSGKPRFITVMKAYDSLENSRANFVLAGEQSKANKVDKIRVDLRQQIIDIFSTCQRFLSKGVEEEEYTVTQMNPSPETHLNIAGELFEKAKSAMDIYKSSGSSAKLLDAYSNYEMAKREYRYAKNKSGLKKATAGAKRAREELKKNSRV